MFILVRECECAYAFVRVCVCVCVPVCALVSSCVFMCTCWSACVCVCERECVRLCGYFRSCVCVCERACVWLRVYVFVQVCVWVRVCTRAYVVPSSCSCERTAPRPDPDASVSKMNGLVKLGKASTGVSVNSLLSSSNACWHCSAQLKGTSFLVSVCVLASVSMCLLGRVCERACLCLLVFVRVLVCDRAGVCASVCAYG